MRKYVWWILGFVCLEVLAFFFLGLWFLLGSIILMLAALPIIYWVLAPRNRWFALVEEGTVKLVVRGKAYRKTLLRSEKYRLCNRAETNSATDEIIHDKDDVVELEAGDSRKSALGGLCLYSLLHPLDDIAIHRFEWTGVTEDGKIEHHPEEWHDYVLLKDDTYYMKVEGAEDKNQLPLTIELVLTIRIVNPSKAIFKIQNWLETVINRSKPTVTEAVTGEVYEELIKKFKEFGEKIYASLADIRKEEFLSRYGVDLRRVQIKDIIPPKDYLATTLLKYTAEKQREATVVTADATKQQIEIEAQAEKTRLETVAAGQAKSLELVAQGEATRINIVYGKIKEFGESGQLVRTLEAMEKSSLAASVTVQAIPGLPQILSGVFGKTPETATQKDLQEIKEALRKLVEKKGGK